VGAGGERKCFAKGKKGKLQFTSFPRARFPSPWRKSLECKNAIKTKLKGKFARMRKIPDDSEMHLTSIYSICQRVFALVAGGRRVAS
jgi:hypothetical protein